MDLANLLEQYKKIFRKCELERYGLFEEVLIYALLRIQGWTEGRRITKKMVKKLDEAIAYGVLEWDL